MTGKVLALPLLLSLALSLLLTWAVLVLARRWGWGQRVRSDGPQSHLVKEGTPSMGGLGIMVAIVLATVMSLAWGAIPEPEWHRLPLLLGVGLVFALVGFSDDFSKLRGRDTKGVKARYRIAVEVAAAVAFAALLTPPAAEALGRLHNWGFSDLARSSGALWGLWVGLGAFVVAGAGNAVNFADGLDGLAASMVTVLALCLGLACLTVNQPTCAVIALAIAGASAGFLWLNAHPARLFMGDVGSLGLGGLLGALAVAAGIEILFGLMALVFVFEVISVILQVIWFRRTGKRLFRMAPIHHALELRGWQEPQIVARLTLVGFLLGALGLFVLFVT